MNDTIGWAMLPSLPSKNRVSNSQDLIPQRSGKCILFARKIVLQLLGTFLQFILVTTSLRGTVVSCSLSRINRLAALTGELTPLRADRSVLDGIDFGYCNIRFSNLLMANS